MPELTELETAELMNELRTDDDAETGVFGSE